MTTRKRDVILLAVIKADEWLFLHAAKGLVIHRLVQTIYEGPVFVYVSFLEIGCGF